MQSFLKVLFILLYIIYINNNFLYIILNFKSVKKHLNLILNYNDHTQFVSL